MNLSNKFEYKYSAPTEEERKEIESIKREYAPKSTVESDMEKLRKLDARVKNPPKILAICFGTVGILVFGLGLTLILEWSLFLGGIAVSAAGAAAMIAAYPLNKSFLRRNKEKFGAEICELADKIAGKRD